MTKRSAEKVISRSILVLATYRKNTMGRALRRRPAFWTVSRPEAVRTAGPRHKQLRLQFEEEGGAPSLQLVMPEMSRVETE